MNGTAIKILILAAIGVGVVLILNALIKRQKRLKRDLNHRYTLHLIRLIVVILCIVYAFEILDPDFNSANMLLKGSALIVAILGFAAQTAIADILCGFLISFNKPFEIGDRIIIEGQDPGIVEDITLRHTVVRIYDDIRIIVPNSQLNSKTVINTSYHKSDRRGIHLQYSISYDTDVQRAADIIRDCVVSSPYTLTVETNGITEDSGPVYFLKFADSALILETTIWVSRNTSSYTAITDMNLRVNKAFKKYGIEIPYNYMNVVRYDGIEKDTDKQLPERKAEAPLKRHFRTDTIRITGSSKSIEDAINAARTFAKRQSLKPRDGKQLELLAEEATGVICNIVDDITSRFWIEGSGYKYKLHISFTAKMGTQEYRKLLSLSSSGKNEAVTGFTAMIMEKMLVGIKDISENKQDRVDRVWSLKRGDFDESAIGESILTALADDIRVSVTSEKVDFVVIKSTQK
ncbi:MAG: mechanosensitive ion channel family protein [Lachnospiraceae bacterium]|nr:mechanosensitive ion channel family protein [Lachnospiraceae bacterium]